ncbi:MAG: UDP-N-acetylglucosamine 2-epimerase (non-hydrolyzing) [Gemmatimonadetes bacterium]|nr:UDP-N-acetylglucosamine 2-epimerase (non-hydrolyzing) [Gemmatimonadota bacterium]MCY3942930.1 UDP-N-acetylglucosamine 2-epimerase (non-hydrolyzing) [Gemmatimonadota bacterium]
MARTEGSQGGASEERPRPRILSVVGTRPEAIKMAPVVSALERRGGCEHRLALTGQHAEMVEQALAAFELTPSYDLELMRPGQTLFDVGHACLDGLREVEEDYSPDLTLVQGDTATVFFAALVTFFRQGRLGHVEAGLRSHRKWSPFPEEMLRRMTDVVSDYCFAPTAEAAGNLAREGVPGDRIFVTGNTVVDALERMRSRLPPPMDPQLAELLASGRRLVLLTAHRRESFGEPIERVFAAVAALANRFEDVAVLYPVHPNPRVLEPAHRILGASPGVRLTDPLDYDDLITALDRAALVLTDSGGIQEEAPTFGVHTLVLREVTERPEGVRAGVATLVGTDQELIVSEASAHLSGGRPVPTAANPYGDGRAGERIADIVLAELGGEPRQLGDWNAP